MVPMLPSTSYDTPAVTTAIVPKPVSCSGAVMGSYAGMLEYLRGMEDERLAPLASAPDCVAETHGRSQGARARVEA